MMLRERQPHDDRLKLLVAQLHATIMSHTSADEAAFVKLSRTQPEAKASVHQHLHAVGAFVDKQVRMMSTRFIEHIYDAGQRFIYAGTHVERLYCKPGRVDADHFISAAKGTLADRVVMTAAMSVLAPIFEVDMPAEQHAYRANLSAHTAVRSVHGLITTGHTQVIEGDLAGYFDSIPHAELMQSVARRVSDRHLLHLIKMWLDAPVEDDDVRGGKKRTTPNKDSGRGVPQGAPISPLLPNLYMRRFILGWRKRGLESWLRAKSVSYADDYVICCKGKVDEALVQMRRMMEQLKLTINEAKTLGCQLPQERFEFLGYEFGRCYSIKTGRAYFGTRPSKKSLSKIIGAIRESTNGRTTWQEAEDLVSKLNRKLVGWSNYFSLGPVSHAYRAIDRYTTKRLRRWLRKKHKVKNTGKLRFTQEYMHEQMGLVRLALRTQDLPWAKA